MNLEQLQKYCSTDPDKKLFEAPFTVGEFTYATNGHILLRVPKMSGFEDREHNSTTETMLERPVEAWFPCPVIPAPPRQKCDVCEGTGKAYACPECEDGAVQLKTKFNDYECVDCKSCDGAGQLSKEEIDSLKEHFKWIDVIEMPCENCDGGYLFTDKSISLGTTWFSDRYLSLLCQLPACEIGITSITTAARIRFDGGEGLIMPRKAP